MSLFGTPQSRAMDHVFNLIRLAQSNTAQAQCFLCDEPINCLLACGHRILCKLCAGTAGATCPRCEANIDPNGILDMPIFRGHSHGPGAPGKPPAFCYWCHDEAPCPYVLLPCGHQGILCEPCGDAAIRPKPGDSDRPTCPLCRTVVLEHFVWYEPRCHRCKKEEDYSNIRLPCGHHIVLCVSCATDEKPVCLLRNCGSAASD